MAEHTHVKTNRRVARNDATTLHNSTQLHVRIHFTRTLDRYSFRAILDIFNVANRIYVEFKFYTNVKISFLRRCREHRKIFDCDWKNVLDHNCKLADLKRHVDDQAPSVTGNANLCASRHSLATSWQENRMRPNARLCMQLSEERRCFLPTSFIEVSVTLNSNDSVCFLLFFFCFLDLFFLFPSSY